MQASDIGALAPGHGLRGRSACIPAATEVEVIPVISAEQAPRFFPLARTDWPSQQRSAARGRAAGMPATPLEVTAADVLGWDRRRGEPPLAEGFCAEVEQALPAQASGWLPAVSGVG